MENENAITCKKLNGIIENDENIIM